jgi:hypothetical protein
MALTGIALTLRLLGLSASKWLQAVFGHHREASMLSVETREKLVKEAQDRKARKVAKHDELVKRVRDLEAEISGEDEIIAALELR